MKEKVILDNALIAERRANKEQAPDLAAFEDIQLRKPEKKSKDGPRFKIGGAQGPRFALILDNMACWILNSLQQKVKTTVQIREVAPDWFLYIMSRETCEENDNAYGVFKLANWKAQSAVTIVVHEKTMQKTWIGHEHTFLDALLLLIQRKVSQMGRSRQVLRFDMNDAETWIYHTCVTSLSVDANLVFDKFDLGN
ncbi:hypothetical protein F4780DRAFT_774455 [Xylariomycetidae sp. FL0641]|nr:hypothetical protein F4780DRAFT_774455 [Xylariomycetidae sp. FL0641]